MPERIRDIFSHKQGFIIVSAAEDQQLNLTYQVDGQTEQLGLLEPDKSTNTYFRDLLAGDEKLGKAKVILRLTGKEAIQKELSLPIATKENIDQVVAYELDRYTPFKADQVYFAVKRFPKQSKEVEQFKIQLVLTTKETLDELYGTVKAMGIEPMIADYEGNLTQVTNITSTSACILSCGSVIASSTTLTSNLTGCTGNGLNITGNDIVLDCNGSIIGGEALAYNYQY